jgi:hypothetical protein
VSTRILESVSRPNQAPSRPPIAIEDWRRIFSFPVLLGAMIVAGTFIASGTDAVVLGKVFTEGDAWWHLASGQQILATHTFPQLDTYSYTASGTTWIAYGWLWEVLMAAVERRAHLQGLAGLLLFCSGLLFLLLYFYAWLRSRNIKAAVVACAASMPIAGPFISLRPQLIGAVFFVLVLILVELFRQGRTRALWLLPPIFVLWVNTHGSFVLGLGILGLYWIAGLVPNRAEWLIAQQWTHGQRLQLETTILACLLGLCVSPYGTRLAAYPFEFSLLQGQIKNAVLEWQPLSLGETHGQAFVAVILLLFALQTVRPARYRVGEVAFFVIAALCTCLHERFLLSFTFAALPMVAVAVVRYVPPYNREKDKPFLNVVLIVAVLGAVAALFPSERSLQAALARNYPVEAERYLQRNPPVHLWNEDIWGGYLIYSSGGKIKPFLDGRFDIYAYRGVLSDYLSIIRLAPETPFIFRKYDIDTVLLHRNAPLGVYLESFPGWKCVYQDNTSEVYRRISHSPQ